MRLLLIFLSEPVPEHHTVGLGEDLGANTAAEYAKAMVDVLLKQLQGLENTRIRFCYAPDDAGDAIRFWLLPQMHARPGISPEVYAARRNQHDDKHLQEVDFYAQGQGSTGDKLTRAFEQGFLDGFQSIAAIGSDCPECGARWINLAFARMERANKDIMLGPSQHSRHYLLASKQQHDEFFTAISQASKKNDKTGEHILEAAKQANITVETLPTLRRITSEADWKELMQSPLAAATKKALGERNT
ncbi:DUF2064 domain-containing protein [Verrucomicrobiaceae bacterium N1E253]|uniref:DUF2064 domain-containing protein n=1 Tax=Oceaniferula marina TaxID=2748318 RepID=A0A851GM43_9BACT|nr:DUF2064 domain-containing protein [Oceaniferula marina]NWK56901.1 DUF2064 domain-containing protein [Oceaniferula marina]